MLDKVHHGSWADSHEIQWGQQAAAVPISSLEGSVIYRLKLPAMGLGAFLAKLNQILKGRFVTSLNVEK